MSKLNVTIPHNLPDEEALRRIKQMLGQLKQSQKEMITDVREDWQGNQGSFGFKAKGFDLSGTIDVKPGKVDIDAHLPFALSFFKGKIAEVIRENAAKTLAD